MHLLHRGTEGRRQPVEPRVGHEGKVGWEGWVGVTVGEKAQAGQFQGLLTQVIIPLALFAHGITHGITHVIRFKCENNHSDTQIYTVTTAKRRVDDCKDTVGESRKAPVGQLLKLSNPEIDSHLRFFSNSCNLASPPPKTQNLYTKMRRRNLPGAFVQDFMAPGKGSLQ